MTSTNRRFSGSFLGFLVCGILLRALTIQAPTPENSQNLWLGLPAFGVFALFVTGMVSWGAVIRKFSRVPLSSAPEEALFDLASGSVFFYLLSYVLTLLHLFSSGAGFLLWAFLATGFGLARAHDGKSFHPGRWFDFGNTWYSRVLMGLLPMMVAVKLLEGLQFHQHGDAYVTYLPGPRLWAERGDFSGFLRYSQLFLSTSWESLFAWGTALMGLKGGSGLDLSQWFSQWVTGGIGFFGASLAGLAICRRLAGFIPVSNAFHPVIVLSSLQLGVLAWTQNLAKNDFGIIFWGLSAFYFSVFGARTNSFLALAAGWLLGAAVVGKLTLGIFGVVLGAGMLFRGVKPSAWFAGGGLLGALPVLIRNFTLTKNPFYPWLPNVFPSPIANDFVENGAAAALSQKFRWSDVPEYWNELYHTCPWVVFLGVIPFLPRKFRTPAFQISLVPVLAYAGFTVWMRPSTNFRYQNAALVLLALLGCHVLYFLVERASDRLPRVFRAVPAVLLSFGFLAKANLTLFTLLQIGNEKKFAPFAKRMGQTEQIGGPAKVWIRSHIKPSDTIISFGDVHIYYLLDYPLTEVGQSVEYGRKIFKSTLDEAEAVFRNAPFDYLYLAGEDYYKDASFAKDQAQIEDIMKRAGLWSQKCKVFDNGKAQVWDLKCLRT